MCSSGKSAVTPAFAGAQREKECIDSSGRASGGQQENSRSSIIRDIVDDLNNAIINLQLLDK